MKTLESNDEKECGDLTVGAPLFNPFSLLFIALIEDLFLEKTILFLMLSGVSGQMLYKFHVCIIKYFSVEMIIIASVLGTQYLGMKLGG